MLFMDETLTLGTKVTYKKRRNPRAFKLWDSVTYNAIMVQAAEIHALVERASNDTNKPINELGKTTIDTDVLYHITGAYLDLYRKLLGESLLKTGNIRTNPNIH